MTHLAIKMGSDSRQKIWMSMEPPVGTVHKISKALGGIAPATDPI